MVRAHSGGMPAHLGVLNQEPAKCINYQVFGVWISLPHIVSDLVILILPLPVLWRMQMARTKKLGLTVTFLTGSM